MVSRLIQTSTPHLYSIVCRHPFIYPRDYKGFLQPPEDNTAPASEYNARDTTHSYPPLSDTHNSVPGSARVIVLTVMSQSPLPTLNPPSNRLGETSTVI